MASMIEAPIPASLLKLSPITEKPYKTRVGNVASARQQYSKLADLDKPRSRLRALTKGMLGGNPPYNEAERKRLGLKWTANLNFMGLAAAVDSARTPYYDLITGSKELVDCCTAYKPKDPNWSLWNQSITSNFDKLLKGWDSFYDETWWEQYEMLVGGAAINLFDETGWKWRALSKSSALVPQRSKAAVNNRLPYIYITLSYTIPELWNMIRDEKAAEQLGFDVNVVKRAIMASDGSNGPNNLAWKNQPWEEWQRRLDAHDFEHYASEDVAVVHLYVQELTETGKSPKISHFMFTAEKIPDPNYIPTSTEPEDDFIRKDLNKYDSYDEALIAIFQNSDGQWHDIKGMAEKGFKHEDVNNKLMCKTIDNAFLRASLMLIPGTTSSSDKYQLTVRSDVTILPQDTTVQQFQHAGDIEGSMAVSRMIVNHQANNLGVYNQRTLSREDGRGEQPTATQVEMQATKEATLSNGQIGLYYLGRDRLYFSAFKRAVASSDSDAQAFVKACREDGVPMEALKQMDYVRCNRSSGYGSQQMKKINLGAIASIVASLPEEGKSNFLDDFISAYGGVDKVERYNPKLQPPTDDQAWAVLENTTLHAGSNPVIFSGQDAVVHLDIHFQDAQQTLAPIKQSMDADQPNAQAISAVMPYIQVLIPHMEGHIANIQNDPARKDIAKLYQLKLRDLVSFSNEMFGVLRDTQRQMEIQAQEEQQANALSALDQAKIQSQQISDQLKIEKMQKDEERKNMKFIGNETRANAKTEADINRSAVTTATDIQLKTAKNGSSTIQE